MFDFSLVAEVASALAASGVLGSVLLPAGLFLYKFLLTKLPKDEVSKIDHDMGVVEHVASVVVNGIEQYVGPGNGDDKRTEAIRMIQEILAKRGIVADPNHLEMALQQAVYVLNQAQAVNKQVEQAPASK